MSRRLTLREQLALLTGKLSYRLLRLLGREAGSLPGLLAWRMAPSLLAALSDGVDTLAVCGTNGKTTTCKLIADCYAARGIALIRNGTGANLPAGILTAFLRRADLRGHIMERTAVIECDEAAALKVFPYLRPRSVLVNNLFRDQLDRYGELNTTLRNLKDAIAALDNCQLYLNADDALVSTLGQGQPKALYFGSEIQSDAKGVTDDAQFCPFCGKKLHYERISYAHLGKYICSGCGYRNPEAALTLRKFESETDGSRLTLAQGERAFSLSLKLQGLYNGSNAAAAALVLLQRGFTEDEIRTSFAAAAPAFGRQEHFSLCGGLELILAKNPVGLSQVFSILAEKKEEFVLVLCLNDKDADGRDISWIWDADFELLQQCRNAVGAIFLGGTRAEELALRLKYAELSAVKTELFSSPQALVQRLSGLELPVSAVCTYTAMRELRPLLMRSEGRKQSWN